MQRGKTVLPMKRIEKRKRVIFCTLEKAPPLEELNPITALAELGYCRINWRLNAAFALWEDEGWLPSRSAACASHRINPRLDYAMPWSAEWSTSAQTTGVPTMDCQISRKKQTL